MVTKVNTEVTLDNKYRFVILDIAQIGSQEVAFAGYIDKDFEKDPKITFFTESLSKDGKVLLNAVTDEKLWKKAAEVFKSRHKV